MVQLHIFFERYCVCMYLGLVEEKLVLVQHVSGGCISPLFGMLPPSVGLGCTTYFVSAVSRRKEMLLFVVVFKFPGGK